MAIDDELTLGGLLVGPASSPSAEIEIFRKFGQISPPFLVVSVAAAAVSLFQTGLEPPELKPAASAEAGTPVVDKC